MIRYDNVSIGYNDKILLSGFSLNIQETEKVILWGPSGSGKSSLLSLIPGFNQPLCGCVYVDGIEVNGSNIGIIRGNMAWVPQEIRLPFDSVEEAIDAVFDFKNNRNKKPEQNKIKEYMACLGLDFSIYNKKMNEISGGENQRLMIAIAALMDKKILLLDEPTSALDSESIQRLITFLHSMKNTTMLAISHDERFTESFNRQILIGQK